MNCQAGKFARENRCHLRLPGTGQGRVRDILKDAIGRDYDSGISLEPHMVVVFHDAPARAGDDDPMR